MNMTETPRRSTRAAWITRRPSATMRRSQPLRPRSSKSRQTRESAITEARPTCRAGRSAEAKADLEAVLAAEGESADLLLALGLVAYEGGTTSTPRRSATREHSLLNPAIPRPGTILGVVEFRREAYSKAREDFEKAVALDPKYTDAWLNLADVYDELGLGREQRDAMAKAKALGAKNEG